MKTKRSFRKNRSTRKHSGGVKKSQLLMGALGLGSLAGASAAPAQGPSILGSGQAWSNGPGRSANNYKNTARMTMRNRNYQRYDPIVNYQGPGASTIAKMYRDPVVVPRPNTAALQKFNMATPVVDYKGPGASTIAKMYRDPVVFPRANNAALQKFNMASPVVNYKGPGLSTMRNKIKKMNRVHEVAPFNMWQNVKPNQKAWQMNVNPNWSAIGKMNRVRNVGALPNMGKYYVPAENMGSFHENWKVPVWNAGRVHDLERNFKFDVKPEFNPAELSAPRNTAQMRQVERENRR